MGIMRTKKKLSRRNFLKTGTGIAASAPLAPAIIGLSAKDVPCAPSPLNQWPGRVVLNYNNMQTATQTAGNAASETTIKKMVEAYAKDARKYERLGEWAERIGWERFFEKCELEFTHHLIDDFRDPAYFTWRQTTNFKF